MSLLMADLERKLKDFNYVLDVEIKQVQKCK